MSREFFEQLQDALIGFLDPKYRSFSSRATSRNIKVWFGEGGHEHYEVQVVRGPAIEVGFHSEYGSKEQNEDAIARHVAKEKWRRALGADAEPGTFIGAKSSPWRRISEVWQGADAQDPETAVEAADRLAEYIHALEPLRTD